MRQANNNRPIQIFHLYLFCYKLYLKTSKLHLAILSFDRSRFLLLQGLYIEVPSGDNNCCALEPMDCALGQNIWTPLVNPFNGEATFFQSTLLLLALDCPISMGFVPCDRSLNPHNALALNVTS